MPGLYTHTTRANDVILDATIYNGDHQNHIDNADAANLGGHSANATQMQATTDPGEVASENLAASIADELERLRFTIKEMKNSAQWYTSTHTREESVGYGYLGSENLQPTGLTNLVTTWLVPAAYASGNLTFKLYQYITITGGVVASTYNLNRGRTGSEISHIATSTSFPISTANTLIAANTVTVNSSDFTNGDTIRILVRRDGDDGSDTATGVVVTVGITVSYTAYAGRP